jgi:polyphosphate glucokinase
MAASGERRTNGSHRRMAARGAPFTLGVDIGGSRIKASVLDRDGALLVSQIGTATPTPAQPQAVLDAIAGLAAGLPPFDRISVGFPGVVKGGGVITAPNLGTDYWADFRLIEVLSQRLSAPVRMLNDAAVQGLGVVEGPGLECVLTLGTGVGCALFRDRRLLLHLEFGQMMRSKGQNYDAYVGQQALVAKGVERWNRRVRRTIDTVTGLTSCDRLYIGGGNARKLAFALPAHVRVASNIAGITGGVRLWEPEMDEYFRDEPMAQMRVPEQRR